MPAAPSRSRLRRSATAPRRGMALILALLATVLIGAIVAGAVYASTQEYRVGRNAVSEPRALAIAEAGLNGAAGQLRVNADLPTSIGGGVDVAAGTYVLANNDRVTTRLTWIGDSLYLLTATGASGFGNAAGTVETAALTTRRTSLVLSSSRPQMTFLAALTSNGITKIGGSSEISGNDANPPTWQGCGTLSTAKPAIVTADSSDITISGNKVSVAGAEPRIKEDSAAADTNTYFKYGSGSDWNTLRESADIRLPTGWNDRPLPKPLVPVGAERCRTGPQDSLRTNWGEPVIGAPLHPCTTYFPLIYAEGNAKITGGRGQGILLVEGDLEVAGGFEFFGPVIVRGSLKTTGTGGHFNGGVMAANVDLEQNVVLGDAVISFSSCAIERALRGSATLRPVATRAWAAGH